MYSNFDVTPLSYIVKHAYIKHAYNKLILIMIFISMGLKIMKLTDIVNYMCVYKEAKLGFTVLRKN